jgi:hypothetical protein
LGFKLFFISNSIHFFLTTNAIQRFGKMLGTRSVKQAGRVPNILPKRCMAFGKKWIELRNEKSKTFLSSTLAVWRTGG